MHQGLHRSPPNLDTDHTMGVRLGEYALQYEAFDNKVASGNV